MSERNTAKAEGRVAVSVPRARGNEDPNLFVSVNGKSYLLPKGKKSMVPPEVAAEIERANKAQEAWDERSARMAEESAK